MSSKARAKKVLAIGDLHCGHGVGLTPPAWQSGGELGVIQKALWDHYAETVQSIGKVDLLIVNGDTIDGKGKRSGGTELIEPDLTRQTEMAAECVDLVKTNRVVMTYGTPYHTATDCGADTESQLIKDLKLKKPSRTVTVGGHEWIDVNGMIFDVKHKVGSSGIPHGRATAIKKEALWNMLWAEREQNPKAHVFLRSHVHYHEYAGNSEYLAMTLPALQGPGSKYGVRQCSGTVDFGLVSFIVPANGRLEELRWKAHTIKAIAPSQAIKV
jgi:hypothetical protein